MILALQTPSIITTFLKTSLLTASSNVKLIIREKFEISCSTNLDVEIRQLYDAGVVENVDSSKLNYSDCYDLSSKYAKRVLFEDIFMMTYCKKFNVPLVVADKTIERICKTEGIPIYKPDKLTEYLMSIKVTVKEPVK